MIGRNFKAREKENEKARKSGKPLPYPKFRLPKDKQ
jgi:hypothetical protein